MSPGVLLYVSSGKEGAIEHGEGETNFGEGQKEERVEEWKTSTTDERTLVSNPGLKFRKGGTQGGEDFQVWGCRKKRKRQRSSEGI